MRAVHWKPLRGEVSFQIPSPVTGKLHAIGPIGEFTGVDPEPAMLEAARAERCPGSVGFITKSVCPTEEDRKSDATAV